MEIFKHYLKNPFQIVETHLGIPLDYKQQCIDEIYRLGDSMNQETNVKAIMSSYFIWEETKILNPLMDKITDLLYMSFPPRDPRLGYELADCWSAIYKNNHYTDPHCHEPAIFSFVYYLQTDLSSSPLIFDECNFKVKPTDDLLLIFPGNIFHSVPIQQEGNDRICLAGNFNLKPKTEL